MSNEPRGHRSRRRSPRRGLLFCIFRILPGRLPPGWPSLARLNNLPCLCLCVCSKRRKEERRSLKTQRRNLVYRCGLSILPQFVQKIRRTCWELPFSLLGVSLVRARAFCSGKRRKERGKKRKQGTQQQEKGKITREEREGHGVDSTTTEEKKPRTRAADRKDRAAGGLLGGFLCCALKFSGAKDTEGAISFSYIL